MKKVQFSVWIILLFLLSSCGPVTPVTPTAVPTRAPTWTLVPRSTLPPPTALPPLSVPDYSDFHQGWMTFAALPNINYYLWDGMVYDPEGYLWTTTSKGLYRVNLETSFITHYTSANGLPEDIDSIIYYDGKVWAFSAKGEKIACFSDGKWVTQTTDFGNIDDIFDTGNRLWVVGKNGLYYFDGKDWQVFDAIPEEYSGDVVKMARSKDNSLWFVIYGDDSRTHVLRFNNRSWQAYDNLNFVQRMLTTADGTLWFVYDDSLISFDGQRFTPLVLPGNYYRYDTSELLMTPDQNLWLPMDDKKQAFIINGHSVKKQAFDGFGEVPEDILTGRPSRMIPRGLVFSGHNNIYLYNEKGWKKYSLEDSTLITPLIGNDVIGFTPDGALWSWDSSDLVRFDGKKTDVWPGDGDISSGSVSKIDAKQVLWSINRGSSYVYFRQLGSKETKRVNLHYDITDFSFAADGSIWFLFVDADTAVGFVANLSPDVLMKKGNFIDFEKITLTLPTTGGPTTGGFTSHLFANNPFDARVMVGPDGSVWVYCSTQGMFRYDGKDWKHYDQETTFMLDGSQFVISPQNQVWVVTDKLYEFDGEKWTSYPFLYPRSHDRKLGDCIFPNSTTVAQDDSVWYLANCGEIYRFDGTHWFHFDKQKDLGGINVTKILSAPDGALWFFSADGWARYQP